VVQVTQSNPDWSRELELRLKELEGFESRVGWFEGNIYPGSDTPVAYVAQIQEMGYGKIPPRPYMRPTMDAQNEAWKALAGKLAIRILDGKMDAQSAMELLGEKAKEDIAETITKVNSPPLSNITLAARFMRDKGEKVTGKTIGIIAAKIKAGEKVPLSPRTKPLQDTGRMLDTISSVTVSSA
jgi:hypothetical protein